MTAVHFLVLCACVVPPSVAFGVIIERDRVKRYPTVSDLVPAATVTRSHRRRLRRNRADLRAALRRKS